LRLHRRTLCLLVCLIVASANDQARAADPGLVAAAKKEGSVTWYSLQIVDQLLRPMAAAFEKKYGVKVNYVRAGPDEVALRVLEEARAGRVQADVVDGTQACAGLKPEGILARWRPDDAKSLQKQFVDPDGYWVATNYYVLAGAYNVNLIPRGSQPKTWDDLLDPQWKGKIVWNVSPTTSAAAGVVGLMLRTRGQAAGMAYLRRLAGQGVTGVKVSARQVLDQVIAGEYPIGLQVYPNAIALSASEGAPIAQIPLQPALGAMVGAAVTKAAPHPNAARLLVDFLLSQEGQEIYSENDYLPVNPALAPHGASFVQEGARSQAVFVNPDQEDAALPTWVDVASRLFR
jgi:ABC-type Fe3+ transport system substrate-binding protein